MARIVEQTLTIRLARLAKSTDTSDEVATDDKLMQLIATLPSVCEEILEDASIVVEIE